MLGRARVVVVSVRPEDPPSDARWRSGATNPVHAAAARSTSGAACAASTSSRQAPPRRASVTRLAAIEALDIDITTLEVDAISNAANTELRHGGGVARAIAVAGGPVVGEESRAKAPIRLGEAVATGAGEMLARWVIHAATMGLDGRTSADIIRAATASTLRCAEELGARSLGLVAFGTGVGGFPLDEAARIEIEEVQRHLAAGSRLERVVFAAHGERAQRAFERALAATA